MLSRLDPRTLAAAAVIVAVVPAVIGVLVWNARRFPGRWALGNVLVASALLLYSINATNAGWQRIILANALSLASGIVFLQGVRQFRGLRILWWPEWILGALTLSILAWFRYAVDNINVRILVMSIALASIGFACGIVLSKDMPRERRWTYVFTAGVFIIAGTIQLVRGVFVFEFAPVNDLFEPTYSNTLLFLGGSLGVVAWSLGFIVLTAEGVSADTAGVAATVRMEALESEPVSEMVAEAEVRRQLERILRSKPFRRSAQMERFLTLAVERTLTNRAEELKEYTLGREVFHRGPNYDPRTDAIVRVEAQRLRRKLRTYYSTDGETDPVIIALPSGAYVPVFGYRQVNQQSPTTTLESQLF